MARRFTVPVRPGDSAWEVKKLATVKFLNDCGRNSEASKTSFAQFAKVGYLWWNVAAAPSLCLFAVVAVC